MACMHSLYCSQTGWLDYVKLLSVGSAHVLVRKIYTVVMDYELVQPRTPQRD
jgi:hypothetical protein